MVSLLAKWVGSNDLDRLQGTWNVVAVSVVKGSREADPTKTSIVVKGDTVTILNKDRPGQAMTVRFVLRPSTKPKGIDVLPPPGEAEKPLPGIYDLDGDNLTVCFGEPGSERPTAFVTQREGGLGTLKRAKNDMADQMAEPQQGKDKLNLVRHISRAAAGEGRNSMWCAPRSAALEQR